MSFFTLLFMICISAVLGWFFYDKMVVPRLRINATKKTDLILSDARVLSKTTEVRPYGRGSVSVPYIVFELPDGTRKDFRVESSVYNIVLEGEKGKLAYRELNNVRVFVSFQPVR